VADAVRALTGSADRAGDVGSQTSAVPA